MVNRNYQNGRAFEYKVKNFFQELGAEVVRGAGSHGLDLIIIFRKEHGGMIWAISCKKAKYHNKEEKQKLIDLRENSELDGVYSCYPENGLIHVEEVE